MPVQSLPEVALTEWSRAAGLEARLAQAEAHGETAAAAIEVIRQERDAARDDLLMRTEERDSVMAELESVRSRMKQPRLPARLTIVREARRLFRRWSARPAESHGHNAGQSDAVTVPLPDQATERRAAA